MGVAWLVTQLENSGILVAYPEHDRGIDLVAYRAAERWDACPLQVKAFTEDGFYTNSKYSTIAALRIAYLWHVAEPARCLAYCMPYAKAEEIVDIQHRARKDGVYFTKSTKPLLRALTPWRVQSWSKALFD